ARAVEPVIYHPRHGVRNEHGLGGEARQQRQSEEAVGDGAAEGRSSGRFLVEMDELPVLGRFGEGMDACLIDRQPVRNADLLADSGADLVDAGEWHQKGAGAGGWSDARTSCSA